MSYRFLWDWPVHVGLIPIKVPAIILLQLIQHIYNFFYPKARKFFDEKINYFDHKKHRCFLRALNTVWQQLYIDSPIHETEDHMLYALRIPKGTRPNGVNHNTDHMAARQGVFTAMLARRKMLEKEIKAAKTLAECYADNGLLRGYHLVGESSVIHPNSENTSGDQAIGLCFAYVYHRESVVLDLAVSSLGNDLLRHGGIVWRGAEGVQLSSRGNLRPGFSWSVNPLPVGAQDLTYCAIILAAMHNQAPSQKKDKHLSWAFIKRFYLYFGWLTILWPTAGIWFKRAYHNDNVCMQACRIGYEFSNNWFERWVFRTAAKHTFGLSEPWLNGFFAGLVREMTGNSYPSSQYMYACRKYAMSCSSLRYSIIEKKKSKAAFWPVPGYQRQCGEFLADEDQTYDKEGIDKHRSTLGQMAMIEWSYDKDLRRF